MRAIIGTAGHIDHGKTALVRALTGIDTDRLPAEKERGISIELGFAHLTTPSGDRVGIVDVPGHERFIRQMLAGAQGFDFLLMVVAADDGVMPQTEEHFEICHLLGLRRGAFAITKTDLVSAARVEEVRDEIALLAEGTPLANAPAFAVSAVTNSGIDALREHLIEAALKAERHGFEGEPFRLPIDRVFVLKGHGVVVTGTAAGGAVAPGDEVMVAPRGPRARVREVQVHGRVAASATSGQRIALNLAAVDPASVARGDTVVHADAELATQRFDARIDVRPAAERPLRSQARVRVHLGTADEPARIVWLGGMDAVAPKQSALAQVVLSHAPLVALGGDRFVLRDETGQRTLGGGVVLLANASKHARADRAVVEELAGLESDDPATRMAAWLALCSELGAPLEDVARGARVAVGAARALAASEPSFVRVSGGEETPLVASKSRYESYVTRLLSMVAAYHTATPSAPGIELERLRQALDVACQAKVFRAVVDGLVAEGRLERRGGSIAVAGHRQSMSSEGERMAELVLETLRGSGAMPPTLAELQARHGSAGDLQQLLGVLVGRGLVVKVSSDLYFRTEALAAIRAQLAAYLGAHERITAAEFRDLISASRKYSIPLLDFFDRSGLTIRIGDYRQLRS